MNVLVTGGAGYIGSHFVLALQDAGHDAVVLDDLSTGDVAAIPRYVPLVRGDVGDPETLQRVFSDHAVDAVVHFAASLVVSESVERPLVYWGNNASATRNLVAACVEHGVRDVVLSSSAAVYGPSETPVDETSPTRPISPYGRSKLAAEWILEDACAAHGLRGAALRYFNVAGADPYMRAGQRGRAATHLVKVVAEAVAGRRRAVAVYGRDYATPDGSCVRDYVHVSDLAAAHLGALAWLKAGHSFAAFNCGYGRGASVLEVVAAARRVSGVDFPVEEAERRPGDPDRIVAVADRAVRILGWTPRHADLDAIVASAIEWERRLAAG